MNDYTQKIRLWGAGIDEIRFLPEGDPLPESIEVNILKINVPIAWTVPPTTAYTKSVIFCRQASDLLRGDCPLYVAEGE